jgi:hypothetical protein
LENSLWIDGGGQHNQERIVTFLIVEEKQNYFLYRVIEKPFGWIVFNILLKPVAVLNLGEHPVSRNIVSDILGKLSRPEPAVASPEGNFLPFYRA